MKIRALTFGLAIVLAASAAQAAPATYSCDALGVDRLVVDAEAGRAQIVGPELALRSPNYALPLTVTTEGATLFLTPPGNPGGGAMIPGDASSRLRLTDGILVADEYASQRTLGPCQVADPLSLVEPVIPVPVAGLALTCVPFDTTAAAPEAWTPIATATFTLTFSTETTARLVRPESPAGVAMDGDVRVAARAGKLFITESGRAPTLALNRYSGNVFRAMDVNTSAGRLNAHCTAG